MSLTVHHLSRSQSERIVWLCEELSLPYTLKTYPRSPLLAPPEYKALHPAGTAPTITDTDAHGQPITLAESGAVVQYILARYAHGRLQLPPDDPAFPDYCYWLHFANGTLQPAISRCLFFNLAKVSQDNPVAQMAVERRASALRMLDERLNGNEWLAGETFSAADVMTVVTVSTLRLFAPFGLEGYEGVVGWLERVGKREGYRRAMEKGEPGLEPVLGREAPKGMV